MYVYIGLYSGKESMQEMQIPGFGTFPGVRNGTPFQYSWLENSMGRTWWVTYSPWVCKGSDTAEHICTYIDTYIYIYVTTIRFKLT